jgi:uncharacterized membrane protein YeaQ/YmgE (transglycosylase-associated protein family)
MDLIVTGVVAGVLGTLVMDALNHLFARTGMLLKIDAATIGRMSAGWLQGRFFYRHPSEMKQVSHERLYGYITHYAIGTVLALTYMFGWDFLVGGPPSPVWALVYGFATTIVSQFLVYPSMGLGVFGRRSPDSRKSFFPRLPTICSTGWVWRLRLHLRKILFEGRLGCLCRT